VGLPPSAAAFSGSLLIAKLLLEQGAVLEDSANKSGVTPLMIVGDHVELAEFLIAQGADVNRAESHGYMPITRAFWKSGVPGNNPSAAQFGRRSPIKASI
jgi:ankyrin repeat protein